MRTGSFLQRLGPSGLLTVLVVVLIGLLRVPVPFVLLSPGPTADTLGTEGAGKEPLIRIEGRPTYPTDGALRLTTVEVRGRPGRYPALVQALAAWVNGRMAVVPSDAVFPPGETAERADERNTDDMVQSQQNATIAAMRQLEVAIDAVVAERVVPGGPAAAALRDGDVLLAVDGTPVRTAADVPELVQRHKPGEEVVLRIRRTEPGKQLREFTARIRAGQAPGADGAAQGPPKAYLGILVAERYPFTVDIKLEDIGGPSAGLMFALGIVDKLTPGSLTNGADVAGTGAIEADGTVFPIGGIEQKVRGARERGATVFLTPARNCPAALEAAPEGLRLVRVDTLRDAVSSLEALKTGRGTVSSCADSAAAREL